MQGFILTEIFTLNIYSIGLSCFWKCVFSDIDKRDSLQLLH